MRTRDLRPGFFSNEDLAFLPLETQKFFQCLWCMADREGRLEDRPKRNAKMAFPYHDYDGERMSAELVDAGFIVRYETDDGGKYIQVLTFEKNQRVHPREAASVIPPPRTAKGAPGRAKGDPRRSLPSCTSEPSSTSLPTSSSEPSSAAAQRRGLDKSKPSSGKPDRSHDVRQVFEHYRVHHPKAHPKPRSKMREWRLILARFDEGYTVADLCAAIDGCHRTPWNIGENPGSKQYTDLELIMRNSDKVSRFMEAPIRAGPVLSEKTQRSLRAAAHAVEQWETEERGDSGSQN